MLTSTVAMSTLMNDFEETFVLAFYNSFLKIKVKL